MTIVHVDIHVKPESVRDFVRATIQNARASVQEPGIARFDVNQDVKDPLHFVLVEVYRKPEDRAAHRTTAHYAAWRDAVADMMAEPRTGVEFNNVFPGDEGWS
ncbi:MAG TPA: antibiotic biosynthesis monooxygenase [Bryobacteraceae bacterium]|jgi:quinol monooxygenase YgiN|nr:antibiotic biosynthesis monooxygenase [Bryobacteraceae bacterium]